MKCPNSYQVNIPQWLGEWGNADELGELLAVAQDQQIQRLQLKACKAAEIGQQLHDAEIEALINAAVNTDQSFTCPHGRPLYKVMTETHWTPYFYDLNLIVDEEFGLGHNRKKL